MNLNETMKVKNKLGEQLDVLVSGNPNAARVIVFMHGLGTDKHEGYLLFDDIASALQDNFITIRFDVSGFGKSEGKQSEFCLTKAADDLQSVLEFATKQYARPVNIIAHSFGGYVTTYLNPQEVEKIIYTSTPRPETQTMAAALQKRILAKGELNMDGVSIYHRSSGEIQEIGAKFWKDLTEFDALNALKSLTHLNRLTIFSAKNDDIVKLESGDLYRSIKIDYHEISGDHDYKDPQDRAGLIEMIKKVLN